MTRRDSDVARRRKVDWGWAVVATLFMAVIGAVLLAALFAMEAITT
jgi:hypothetical protein